MNIIETIQSSLVLINTAITLLTKWMATLKRLRKSFDKLVTQVSYENLRMEVALDIMDVRGRRAAVTRTQQVRFLTDEAPVIRELVWGEGDPLATYSVDGARCLGVRREGAKRVMLLEPETQPRKGGKATIVSRRVIKNALIDQDSYAELLAERPTKRLGLKITFPHSRAPKHAYLASSPPAGPTVEVPIKHGRQGRAYLAWSVQDPTMFTTYSLRWKW